MIEMRNINKIYRTERVETRATPIRIFELKRL